MSFLLQTPEEAAISHLKAVRLWRAIEEHRRLERERARREFGRACASLRWRRGATLLRPVTERDKRLERRQRRMTSLCEHCRAPLQAQRRGRLKRFCSDACRGKFATHACVAVVNLRSLPAETQRFAQSQKLLVRAGPTIKPSYTATAAECMAEINLWRAVLEQAGADFHGVCAAREFGENAEKIQLQVQEWFESPSQDVKSFIWIANLLNSDPSWLKKKLLEKNV